MHHTVRKEAPTHKPPDSNQKRASITGFEQWGGYMAAKMGKLSAQYEAQKPVGHETSELSEIFKGVAIFVNGYTRPPAEPLKQLMLKHGGTYHYYHHPQRTTHIIATNLPDGKIRNSKDGEKVVRPDWIVDSVKAGELLPYHDYLLYSPTLTSGQMTLDMKKIPLTDQTLICEEKCSVTDAGEGVASTSTDMSLHSCNSDADIRPHSMARDETANSLTSAFSSENAVRASDVGTDHHPSALETRSMLGKEQKSGLNVKAGDPQFLSEFYNHSRLHHISTAGQELKQYVQDIIHTRKGKTFPGREKLRHLKLGDDIHPSKKVHYNNGGIPQQIGDIDSWNEAPPSATSVHVTRNTSSKIVMHIDMDCFFVSVGLRKYPQFKGMPVAVTHSRGKRGTPQQGSDIEYEASHYRKLVQQKTAGKDSVAVDMEIGDVFGSAKSPTEYGSLSEIASCSYEARAAGLHNGMFLGEAMRLCPNLKTIPYDFEGYSEVSKQLYDTIAEYSLDIEAVSCDELYLDCSELLDDTGVSTLEFASVLRTEIFEKTGCTASAGMGANMLLARLATRIAKPNGQYFLPESEVDVFMKKQKVEDMPGVGYIMASKLEHLGVVTCEDLQTWSLEKLQREFGPKNGQTLYDHCRGKDDREVTTQKERKSVSAEVNYGIRFETEQDVRNFLNEVATEVHQRLKKVGKRGKAVTLKLKMRKADAPKQTAKFMGHGVCDSLSKSVLLKSATDDPALIANQCYQLIQGMKLNPEDYRGLGIQIGKLEPAAHIDKSSKVMERFLSNAMSNKCLPENSSISKQSDLDESVLNALPEDIRNEVLLMYGKKAGTSPTKSKFGVRTSPAKSKFVPNTKRLPAKTSGPVKGQKRKAVLVSPQKSLKKHFEERSLPPTPTAKHNNISTAQSSCHQQSGKANLCGAVMINELRELLKEWFGSMEVPLEGDATYLRDYLFAVIEEKDLEKVDLVLKCFYRLASTSSLLWKETYLSVLSYVQQKMLQDFGYMLKAQSDF